MKKNTIYGIVVISLVLLSGLALRSFAYTSWRESLSRMLEDGLFQYYVQGFIWTMTLIIASKISYKAGYRKGRQDEENSHREFTELMAKKLSDMEEHIAKKLSDMEEHIECLRAYSIK